MTERSKLASLNASTLDFTGVQISCSCSHQWGNRSAATRTNIVCVPVCSLLRVAPCMSVHIPLVSIHLGYQQKLFSSLQARLRSAPLRHIKPVIRNIRTNYAIVLL